MEEAVNAAGSLCQSCGMPMAAVEHFGTNRDSTPSMEYCCFCYQNGNFTNDFTPQQYIDHAVGFHNEQEVNNGRRMSRDEMSLKMRVAMPDMKRWKSHDMTHQAYYKAVNTAVDYISDHLSEQLTLSDISSAANTSGFHFHRIFKAVMRESPGAYIQRLRLEKAIFMLQTSKQAISQIADSTGYQSVYSFTKAFTRRFGISPAKFRKRPVELNYPLPEPVMDIGLEPEIRNIKPKKVVYARVIDPVNNPEAFRNAWTRLIAYSGRDGVPSEDVEYITMSRDISTITKPEHYRSYVCMTAPMDLKPSGKFGIQTIEGGMYAVFTYKGSYRSLDKVYCHIYRYWIPNSDYMLRDITYFEKYLNSPDNVSEEELLTELFIPVQRI